jgi:hypothetical protein
MCGGPKQTARVTGRREKEGEERRRGANNLGREHPSPGMK